MNNTYPPKKKKKKEKKKSISRNPDKSRHMKSKHAWLKLAAFS